MVVRALTRATVKVVCRVLLLWLDDSASVEFHLLVFPDYFRDVEDPCRHPIGEKTL
jgi:hypothetical protein